MKVAASLLGILVLILALSWIFTGNDFFLYKYWAPKQEVVKREVFENTPSFNKGMIQELENMQFQYEAEKDKDSKLALRSIILHRASGYNMNDRDVPASLYRFVGDLKNQKGEDY